MREDTANISPHVPSTSTQNAILSVLLIHISPSALISAAFDNPLRVVSTSYLTTGGYL